MFRSIWQDLVHYFKTGNMIVRLILINILVFVIVNIVGIFLNAKAGMTMSPEINSFLKFIGLGADWSYLLKHPWGIFTHMFVHYSFWHLFGNMILLYFFGRIAGDLLSDRRVLPIYLIGGLIGGLLFIISYHTIPEYLPSYAIGASAAVMALLFAAGAIAPDYQINMIIFSTRLKFIVAAVLFLDLIGLSAMKGSETGHLAHLGGAAFGWFFVYQLRRGVDMSEPVNRFLDYFRAIPNIFSSRKSSRRPQPKVAYTNKEKIKKQPTQSPGQRSDNSSIQDSVDAILDKIKKHGIDSLTDEEQQILNHFRNKL